MDSFEDFLNRFDMTVTEFLSDFHNEMVELLETGSVQFEHEGQKILLSVQSAKVI
jgi:hypothetical protein